MAIQTLTADDFVKQLLSYMPTNWVSPTELQPNKQKLTFAVMKALGSNDSYVYDEALEVQQHFSFTTAVGEQLDALVRDYFGGTLPRFANEADGTYRTRVVARMFTPTTTYAGMLDILTKTLGSVPVIQEKAQANLTGGYMSAGGNGYRNTFSSGGYINSPASNGRLGYDTAHSGAGAYSTASGGFVAAQAGSSGYNVAGHYAYGGALQSLRPYEALITVQQAEPTAPNFLTRLQISALIEVLKPYGTTMWLKVLGPVANGGVAI